MKHSGNQHPTPESHAAALAAQAAWDAKRPDFGKLLWELHPTEKPMERYVANNHADGWYGELLVVIHEDMSVSVTIFRRNLPHDYFTGTYPEAQAWLKEYFEKKNS